jgi:hypothetical protein
MEWQAPVGQTTAYAISLHFEEGTTAIDKISHIPSEQVIYNMMGQRLGTPQKGINIIDNKKVLIK